MQSEEAPATVASQATQQRSLEFAGVVVGITSADDAALEWLLEFLDPWWRPTLGAADWSVHIDVSASRYRAARAALPGGAKAGDCFLFDQQVFTLPAWDEEGHTTVADAERSLCFTVGERMVDVVADPSTNRWRFPLVWILTEIATARLRRHCLDLHAAAVVGDGPVVVIAGPKLSGKTTLALHVLARGARWIGNDRVLLDGVNGAPRVRGVPSAVKVRPDTVVRFPELSALGGAPRPYLMSEVELATVNRTAAEATEFDFAFTPAQVASRLGVERMAEGPLGAFAFPQVRADVRGWDVQSLSTDELVVALAGSVYGGERDPGTATLFEAREGGAHIPTAAQIEAAAAAAPGYRILLGPDAYDDDLAACVVALGLPR